MLILVKVLIRLMCVFAIFISFVLFILIHFYFICTFINSQNKKQCWKCHLIFFFFIFNFICFDFIKKYISSNENIFCGFKFSKHNSLKNKLGYLLYIYMDRIIHTFIIITIIILIQNSVQLFCKQLAEIWNKFTITSIKINCIN